MFSISKWDSLRTQRRRHMLDRLREAFPIQVKRGLRVRGGVFDLHRHAFMVIVLWRNSFMAKRPWRPPAV